MDRAEKIGALILLGIVIISLGYFTLQLTGVMPIYDESEGPQYLNER